MEELLLHWTEHCPRCREAVAEVMGGAPTTASLAYEAIFDQALHPADEFLASAQRRRKEAAVDLHELLALDSDARRTRIDRAIKRFRNPFLVDLLITESRTHLTLSPSEALELADCAHRVALRLPHTLLGDAWAMTCVARSHAYRGNALRVLGELRTAELPLRTAMELFLERGDGDPLIEAELRSLQASLYKDLLRFDEALAALERALELSRAVGQPAFVGHILIQLAIVLADGDRLPEAIATVQEALSMLDPEADLQLYLAAQHNLAYYLEAAGRIEEAERLLAANLDRYRSFPQPGTRLRFAWSLGTIARGLGKLEQARQALEEVRTGFLRQGLAYDAALAGLDLALVYVEQGDSDTLIPLAAEIVPVFEAQERERDTLAALMLFREAARKRQVTAQLLVQLVRHLGRSPLAPGC
jgi:tetratricopeptide (TPR) repeat protein